MAVFQRMGGAADGTSDLAASWVVAPTDNRQVPLLLKAYIRDRLPRK